MAELFPMMPGPVIFDPTPEDIVDETNNTDPVKLDINVFVTKSGEIHQCKKEAQCYEMQYWNHLACECFNMAQCMIMCPPGQDLLPTSMCECVPNEQIQSLYPEGVTQEDIYRSMEEGMIAASMIDQDDTERDFETDFEKGSDHDSDDESDDDLSETEEKVERVTDAFKELEDAANDLFDLNAAAPSLTSSIGATLATAYILSF